MGNYEITQEIYKDGQKTKKNQLFSGSLCALTMFLNVYDFICSSNY